jgi:thiol-disulfide isomerase/thioredoxin
MGQRAHSEHPMTCAIGSHPHPSGRHSGHWSTAAHFERPPSMLDVYCLCAAWCGSCRKIKPEFDGLSTADFHLHWVDIEDHADSLVEVEILTFPTIVVANSQGKIYFAGPIEPRLTHLQRLLQSMDWRVSSAQPSQDWEDFVHAIRKSSTFQLHPLLPLKAKANIHQLASTTTHCASTKRTRWST